MSSQVVAHKQVVRAYYKALDGGDKAALAALCQPGCTMVQQGTGRVLSVKEYWEFVGTIREVLRGFVHQIDVLVGEGDNVATYGTVQATTRDGKLFKAPFLNLVTFEDGKVVELVAIMDARGE